jgi:RNA polymerase sigma-70 factor (ECF subfamily)
MPDDAAFAALMDRLRRGDQTAAWEVFDRYARRLAGLARTRLSSRFAAKLDPEDVVQSVFRSFFHRHADGQFELSNWESLWALLTVITLRKCGHKTEHFLAACRDVRRETVPLSEECATSWQGIARDPTPVEAAVLTETIATLLGELAERDRGIVELSLQGEPAEAISAKLGCSERTAARVLGRVRRRLERLRDHAREDG